jgi:hypothetical protein
MKASRIIGLIIAVIQISSAVALIAGMHTMLGVFTTALPTGEEEIEIQFSDPVVIPFTFSPINNGYLKATMYISFKLIADDTEIASDSALIEIPSGSVIPVELELTLPLSDAEMYLIEGVDVDWETEISVSTLYDLISFSNKMIIEGDGR